MKDENTNKQEMQKNPLNPLFVTIIVAMIGFIGTTVGTIINNNNVTKLETRKFEFDLIKKGLEQPNIDERMKFLKFICNLKLIKDKDIINAIDSSLDNPEDVPSLSTTSSDSSFMGMGPIQIDPKFFDKIIRISALKAARNEVGNIENLNHRGIFVKKYMRDGQGYAWSIGFICWCYSQNKQHNPPFAYVYAGIELERQLRNHGWYKENNGYIPKPGDIYLMKNKNGVSCPGGIVDSVGDDFIKGIEGNVNKDGSDNIKGVFYKIRKMNVITGYGHIDEN